MKVTGVFLNKSKKTGSKLWGRANVKFDDVMSVSGFAIFKNEDGSFNVAPPSTLGKSKNKETGEIEDKWFDNIWINKEQEEGQALIDMIKEKVTLAVRKEEHGEKKAKEDLQKDEEDLLKDDEEPLF